MVQTVADELDATPAKIADPLGGRPPTRDAPIVGARTTDQFEENLSALDHDLSDDQFDRIADTA